VGWRTELSVNSVYADSIDGISILHKEDFSPTVFTLSAQHSPTFYLGKTIMNKDQVTGTVKEISGKIQETVGKLIDSDEQQSKGVVKQAEGKIEKTVGNAKEVLKNAIDKL
jgi:uncharacterized protein YjbJ (UPF0337 family)